jgi:hypothetical protein
MSAREGLFSRTFLPRERRAAAPYRYRGAGPAFF